MLIVFLIVLVVGLFIRCLNDIWRERWKRRRMARVKGAGEANGYSVEDNQQNREKETEIMKDPKMEAKLETQKLMVDTLTQIGCQPTVNEDTSVSVTYQGEHFNMVFGGPYVQIWDCSWASINVNDPQHPMVCEAMNIVNHEYGPTVVTTKPDDNGFKYLHSRQDLLLIKGIPEIGDYVRSNLDLFFRKKEDVRRWCQNLTLERQKEPEKRRPVGFASGIEPEEDSGRPDQ